MAEDCNELTCRSEDTEVERMNASEESERLIDLGDVAARFRSSWLWRSICSGGERSDVQLVY